MLQRVDPHAWDGSLYNPVVAAWRLNEWAAVQTTARDHPGLAAVTVTHDLSADPPFGDINDDCLNRLRIRRRSLCEGWFGPLPAERPLTV